jgi:hypothetical protein
VVGVDAGHVVGQGQGPVHVGADPAALQGVGEQVEPALEVLDPERGLVVDPGVGLERVAGVAGDAEQGPAPEGGELGEVLVPVDLGHVVEDRAEQVVLGHAPVEPADHLTDLVGRVQVVGGRGEGGAGAHRRPPGWARALVVGSDGDEAHGSPFF